ncbi:MAG: SDR family oxidoreductase [Xanthomonadales bacterium]|nr:SDR family oxidoreductase [Gammaproteobacteria bacterium]MBT8053126.1 SDR family oxidoreductase [Gammaproteobacteria bacterium]NND56222.1 SDR family oxidoreductase [Xanthomonadales bacterium]NNK52297.1 SDR family oxidoreductase [Xanthomonadales bacterium]
MTHAAKGKTVFVTGGARGIGLGIVKALAADGYNISFTYRSSGDEAARVRDELQANYPEQTIDCHEVDMSDRGQVDTFAGQIAETEGLYGLAYNAGGSYDTLAALVDQDRAEALFQLNFWALTRLAGAAARPLMRARAGRIIAIGSITAQMGVSGNSIYAASKGAMLSYIRTLAIEIARKGVTANYVSPGYVDTDLMAPYASYREKVEQQIPLRRFAQPEEVGALVSYLFSPLAGYITGAVIPIDGGTSAGLSIQV